MRRKTAPVDRSRVACPAPFHVRMLRWLRFCLVLVLLGATGVGGYFGWLHLHRFIYLSEYFTVETIEIQGASQPLERDARQWVEDYLSSRRANLCRVDRRAVERGLGQLPRSLQVRVRKVYPDTIKASFTERQPIMVANLDRPYLIDRQGVVLAEADSASLSTLGLPILTGVQRPLVRPGVTLDQKGVEPILAAVAFINEADPVLQGKIVEWNLGARQEYTAILRSGTEVMLGSNPPLERLDKLSSALLLKKKLETATYIDLRVDRQIVFK